jgi:predicted phosphoribosyltransferase
VREVQPGDDYIQAESARELAEIERRRSLYRPDRPPLAVEDRTVIVVDDGIATGGTMKAVLKALRESQPRKLVLAVPVAPADSLADLSPFADEVIVLAMPEPFYAVGAHYRDFAQTSDEEVMELLARSRAES